MEADKKKSLIVMFPMSIRFCAASPAAPRIRNDIVTGGEIEGIYIESISVFKDIPFAAPPVGNQRRKAPQPVIPWKGVLKAEKFECGYRQDEEMAKKIKVF